MVAVCVGPGGMWERPQCELRQAATSTRLGAVQPKEAPGLRLPAHKAQQVKEPWAVSGCEFQGSNQSGASGISQVSANLDLVPG